MQPPAGSRLQNSQRSRSPLPETNRGVIIGTAVLRASTNVFQLSWTRQIEVCVNRTGLASCPIQVAFGRSCAHNSRSHIVARGFVIWPRITTQDLLRGVERPISKRDALCGLYRTLRPPASPGFQATLSSQIGSWLGLRVADFIEPKPKKGRCRVRVPV